MIQLDRTLRLAGILLMLAIGGIPDGAAVLCVAPGGHVAVEPGQERCVPATSDHHDDTPCDAALAHAETCCAPCADIPLGSPWFARGGGFRDPSGGAPACILVSAAVPGTAVPGSAAGAPGFRLRGTLPPTESLLETIRLRC